MDASTRIATATAPARVALAGNPSDGYGGRTLSLAIANFSARVEVSPAPRLEILPAPQDSVEFANVERLVEDVRRNGYYGGLRLLKATIKRLADHCAERGVPVGDRGFAIHYETDIPRGVGLGGSSAIVTAAVLALLDFLDVEMERDRLPALILSIETDELGIAAGLQDRVAQVLGGLTFMDFDPRLASPDGGGAYEPLDPELLPPLFVAHLAEAAEPSEAFHSRLHARFEAGEPAVVEAMSRLGSHAARARDAVERRDAAALGAAMDATFEARRSIAALDPRHVRLVELARSLGAPANFAGSGGAIVGIHRDAEHLGELREAFAGEGARVEACAGAPAARAAGAPA
jgi:glucuronokinase